MVKQGDVIRHWFDFRDENDDGSKNRESVLAEVVDLNSHKKFVITEFGTNVPFIDIISIYKKVES